MGVSYDSRGGVIARRIGKARTYTTLTLEASGFSLVILLIWADEYLDLPHLLFGAPATPVRISEVLFEAGTTFLLGAGVIVASWRTNQRITQLETLLLICASCQRVSVDGQWLAFEGYIKQRDHLVTSHGGLSDVLGAADGGAGW
jgi:hypothetical protein